MKKGEATRQRILAEAGRQAAAKGLTGISLNDVAEAAGLSKSGLFKHFDSKEAMQLAVLKAVIQRFEDFVWHPARALPAGRTRLEALFENWLDWESAANAAGGCLIRAASVEVDDQPGVLRDYLKTNQQQWQTTITRQLQALRDPPLTDAEARAAAFQMKSFARGYADAHRLLEESDAREAAKAAFAALLDRTIGA